MSKTNNFYDVRQSHTTTMSVAEFDKKLRFLMEKKVNGSGNPQSCYVEIDKIDAKVLLKQLEEFVNKED